MRDMQANLVQSELFARYHDGLHIIISRTLHDRGLSVRELERLKVTKTRHSFFKRLESGRLTGDELAGLFSLLEIDHLRAWVAIMCMNDPEQYFEALSETASSLMQFISTALIDKASTLQGSFDPIRPSLCSTLANRTVDEIIQHQRRLQSFRSNGASAAFA